LRRHPELAAGASRAGLKPRRRWKRLANRGIGNYLRRVADDRLTRPARSVADVAEPAGAVRIRTLPPDDWSVWRALRLAALADAPAAFSSQLADWQGDGDQEDRWRDRLSIPGSHNILAVLDGQPVGMASGMPTGDPGVVGLISMWVAPQARRRGVGEALVREIERWARSVGARAVRLDVADGNRAAAELYERTGFAYTGELGDVMPDGVRRERVMAKQLY
jgi:ribosomal protein S18 acetylase RimI-like enzyme